MIKPRPLGSIPMRRVTLFVSAMFVALLTTAVLYTAPLYAQEAFEEVSTEAEWAENGVDIDHNGWPLRQTTVPPEENQYIPSLSGTVCEDSEDVYYSGVGQNTNPNDTDSEVPTLLVICLDEGADTSDKSQPIGGQILVFRNYEGNENISEFRPSVPTKITIVPEGENAFDTGSGDTEPTSNCTGEGTEGVGWMVCPLTRWLAKGMDALYSILSDFLTVSPLLNGGVTHTIWRVMQNFANILFIIGFLIIIYSQITSLGVSNYGIKRLLPRLIIAAVLVNVSYWVCAAAVDLSNILGVAIKEMFDSIVAGIEVPKASVNAEDINWTSLAVAILSGGALLGGTIVGVVASAGASLWFLLVALMGVIVSALVAILVLAARQALITILVIISPLAFVAYLLPSTEKYFDRWRSLFMTMLLIFPIFSVIFGGSQLAGMAIVYSALENPESKNFFNIIILGMIVQVAPVVITPVLIRLSGSILGRVAGMVNDPNKGIIDKTRKFAQNRHDFTKNRRLWDWDGENNRYRNRGLLSAGGRRMALREIDNSHKIKAWESGGAAAYEQTQGAHEVYRQSAINEMRKSAGEDEAKAHFNQSVADTDSLRALSYQQRRNRDDAAATDKQVATLYEGLKAEPSVVAVNALERRIGKEARDIDEETRLLIYRENAAKLVQDSNLNKLLAADEDLQKYAGYDGVDPHGATRVASLAQEKEGAEYSKRVTAFLNTQKKVEATNQDRMDIATGVAPSSPFSTEITHFADDVEGRAAAIRFIGEGSPVKDIHFVLRNLNLTETATGDEAILRSETADITKRTVFVSSSNRAKIAQAQIDSSLQGDALMDFLIKDTLDGGAFSVAGLAKEIDRDDLHEAALYIEKNRTAGTPINLGTRTQLMRDLTEAVTNPDYAGSIDKRKKELREILLAIDPTATLPPKLQ